MKARAVARHLQRAAALNGSRWPKIPLVVLLLMPALGATQAFAPSDVDLKSAYCVRVLRLEVETTRSILAAATDANVKALGEGAIAEVQNNLNRVMSYLVPKTYLDSTGLLAATNRGQVDYAAAIRHGSICAQRCPFPQSGNKVAGDAWTACQTTCAAEEPAIGRVSSCSKIDWLPF